MGGDLSVPRDETPGPEFFLREAAKIIEQRQDAYGDAWKKRGWRGNTADVARKAERIFYNIWLKPNILPDTFALDDVYDLMNYCAFMLSNVHANNEWGEPL